MKKTISVLLLFLFLFLILMFPREAVAAASDGLILWYTVILPTLLPFTILSNILLSSGYCYYITKYLYKLLRPIYPVSQNGSFVLLAGLLFGFPLGSKLAADFVRANLIEPEEGNILICICNNFSPVFISSYVFYHTLKAPALLYFGCLFIYAPALVWGYFKLKSQRAKTFSDKKNAASRSQLNFKIIDAGIMNGFETLTKLGGYIMLFSIFSAFVAMLPVDDKLPSVIASGITEATNGIHLTGTLDSFAQRFCSAIGFTIFGGFCGMAQTLSMIKDSPLSGRFYFVHKVAFALVGVILAYAFITLAYPH